MKYTNKEDIVIKTTLDTVFGKTIHIVDDEDTNSRELK
jgi:hypothetical protein